MRTRSAVLAALALAPLAATPFAATPLLHPASAKAAAGSWGPRAAAYGVAKQTDVSIPMSDGVVLKADILRPATPGGTPAPGSFPAILTQTPYNKAIPATNFEDDYLVQRGYVQVIVDVRGTGSSGGTWESFGAREQQDYAETAAWVHRLAGTTGAYGTYGISYGAIDQIYTAAAQPPGLKGSFAVVPLGDAYRDVVASGGQIDTGFIPFWLGEVTAAALLPTATVADPVQGLEALGQHALGITSFQLPTVLSAAAGEDNAYDGPFFRTRSPLEVVDRIRTPTFIVGGEYDLFQRGEPMLYNRLRANGVPTRLLIGPWTHLQTSVNGAAPLGNGLPTDGVPAMDELALRWFDHYVAGRPDPALDNDIPPVTVYRLGAGHFEPATSYPPADTRYGSLLLGGGGSLGPARARDGTAALPYLPVAGVCSASLSQWTAGIGAAVQPCATNNQLNDALGAAFDLPVTGAPLRFAGTSTARLFVSTTGSDGSVTARLEDVAPDGTSRQLSAGWQVLSLRAVEPARSTYAGGLLVRPWHPYTRASVLPVQSGRVYEVDVEIFPTVAQVPAGHTLRLALASADSPHLTPPLPQAVSSVGTMTVYADAAHPSSLTLGLESAQPASGTSAPPAAATTTRGSRPAQPTGPARQSVRAPAGALAATGIDPVLPGLGAALLAAAAAVASVLSRRRWLRADRR